MKLKVRGKKHIEGEVKISGAKNSAVAVIPAAILTDEEITSQFEKIAKRQGVDSYIFTKALKFDLLTNEFKSS